MLLHLLCVAISLFSISTTSHATETPPFINVLTESTPLTRIDSSTPHSGEATRFVTQVLNKAGVDYTISYVPWKRSYLYGLTQQNVLIYPISRTQEREDKFIWLGKIMPINYFLFKLKSRTDIKLDNVDDAQTYTIGVVNHHSHHEYLLSKGFTTFEPVNNSTQNLAKLLLGRIDLFPMSSGGLEPLCNQLNVDCSQVAPAIALDNFSDGLYMAFSKGSDERAVKQVNIAYQSLYGQSQYQELFKHRLNAAQRFNTSSQISTDKAPQSTEPSL